MEAYFIVLLDEVTDGFGIPILIQIFTLEFELVIFHAFVDWLWEATKFIPTEPIKF